MLYPLKFTPVLLDKMWGGTRLKPLFAPASETFDNIGEAWLLSAYEGRMAPVANGHLTGDTLQDIIEVYMNELVGDAVYERFGNTFPLLIKLIDADADLSIQVHPDDDYAIEHDNSLGKAEMWYVMPQSAEDASLLAGWKEEMTQEKVCQGIVTGTIMQKMCRYHVKEGDYIQVRPGLVHTLQKGTVVAEIQENSDATYRLFDYNRIDNYGKKRPLHIEKALDVLDFSPCTGLLRHIEDSLVQNIAQTQFFTVNLLTFESTVQRDYAPLDSFVAYLCVSGEADIETTERPSEVDSKVHIGIGELCLIPAILNDVTIIPKDATKLLEVYIEAV